MRSVELWVGLVYFGEALAAVGEVFTSVQQKRRREEEEEVFRSLPSAVCRAKSGPCRRVRSLISTSQCTAS